MNYGEENSMNYISKSNNDHHSFREEMSMRNKNIESRTIKMNVKETGKMERVMKTGIIAAGTVAAAGLAFGMSPVTAYAAEAGTNAAEAVIQNTSEAAVPETVEEARRSVDVAQADVETSEAAVKEAQNNVDEAQTAVNTASETAETARGEADEAFETAKAEAAEADADARNNVEAAERNVDEAEGEVQQAGEDVASAETALEEAENSAQEAASESRVTEADIREKESELADAEADLNDAATTLDEAEDARNEAADDADRKEAARNEAENTVKEAAAEKAEADDAAASAEDAAAQAGKELRSAEDLKNGSLDIKDTIQYKEQQEAKEMRDKASEAAAKVTEDTDKAYEDLADAEAAVSIAETDLNSAEENMKEQEAALSAAEKIKNAAESAKADAQSTYDSAATDAAGAQIAVSDAENAVKDAKEGVRTAGEAKTAADDAVKTASGAVETAREDAEASVDGDIAYAKKDAADKQSVVKAAREALNAAAEKYKQGMLGLIDWMLAKDDLTKIQNQDLTFAREVLEKASEENFTEWHGGNNTGLPAERNGKVVVIGDEKDSTNLENLLRSIEIMKKINELRATDDNYTGDLQRNDSFTNFYFMATAEAGAMRGAGLGRHSLLTTSCENLAFNYYDPTVGWYDEEKAVFDSIKEELGIAKIESMDDVARIEEEADRQKAVVGHYTNLFWAKDQVMGVGFTRYWSTSCYNASNASNYTSDKYGRGMHLYTVEEFERLVTDYYKTVNKSACEEALEDATTAQSEAENRLQTLRDNREAAVEAALQNAKAELASKESDAKAADQILAKAKENLAGAEKTLEEAGMRKKSAEQALQTALKALDQAVEESRKADTDYAFAAKAGDDAKRSVKEAESVLKDAIAGKTAAAAVLEEKRAALRAANTALDEAEAACAAAEKKLADLTSDDTLDALREQKLLADAAFQSALEDQNARNEALRQAESVLAEAEISASEARSALQKAENRLSEAILARDAAKEEVSLATSELKNLRDQYAPVLRATAACDAAKDNLSLAEAVLKDKESNLLKAQDELTQALREKEITADKLIRATGLSVEEALKEDIEDPDFAYLNEYVSAIRTADADLEAARADLENAYMELAAKKAENENAQKAYIAAVADLVIAEDRTGMFRVNQESAVNSELSAKASDYHETITPVVSESGAAPIVLKVSESTSKPVLKKVESTGHVYSIDPVATGDNSNTMALLAELLASAGLMAVVFKKREEDLL